MKSSVTSTLLLICIISITVSCLVSFTQAEGLKARYNFAKRAQNTTTGSTTGGSFTTGAGKNTTTAGGSSTTGGVGSSGNSTKGNTTTGGLTSGGASSSDDGIATTGIVRTNGTTTSGPVTVIIVVTYRVTLDPTTFNKTKAIELLAAQLNVSVSSITIVLEAVSAKRIVFAVGTYDMKVTITTLQTSTLGSLGPAALNATFSGNSVLNALTASGGISSISSLGVTRTQIASSTGSATTGTGAAVGVTSTTGTPDDSTAASGLSAGAIAGIVIGVIAVVVIVVVAVVVTKRRGKKHAQVQPLLNNGHNGPHYP